MEEGEEGDSTYRRVGRSKGKKSHAQGKIRKTRKEKKYQKKK